MENYKILTLITGDQIVCTTEHPIIDLSKDQAIIITNPVILNVVRSQRGSALIENYVMLPWISFAEDEVFQISTRQIITTTNIKDQLKKNYIEFINERLEASLDQNSNDMESILEELFDEIGEEDDQDETGDRISGIGRTSKNYH
jgi:hypothetical protein